VENMKIAVLYGVTTCCLIDRFKITWFFQHRKPKPSRYNSPSI